MSNFAAANLITKLPFTLQSRLLSLPWRKKSVVRCFSHKGDSPQVPVRYIPKRSRDANQGQCITLEDNAPKHAIPAKSSSRNGNFGHNKTLDRTKGSRRSRLDHQPSNVSFDDVHGLDESIKCGNRIVETKCLKTHQEVVECMNLPRIVGQELQDFKKDGQGIRYASNQENDYDDGFTDSEYRMKGSRRSRVDDTHGVSEDIKLGEGAVEAKCLKSCQEVVEYMNMPQEVGQKLQNFRNDGEGLGNASNQENSYDNGYTDTGYRMKDSQRSRVDHEQSTVSFDDAHGLNKDIKHGKRAVETRGLKFRQEAIKYMNMPQEELQNFKTDGEDLGWASNQENGYDTNTDGYDQENLCVPGVKKDIKHGKRAVETRGLKFRQEAIKYMNMPQEELQNFKTDGEDLGWASNQENGYDTNTEYMEVLEEDVEEAHIYSGIHDSKQERSNSCGFKQGAEKLAIELLAKRAYTVVELHKKLIARNFPMNVVEAVISDFQERGLINDSLYAEVFSHSRWKSSSWGPRRIKQALVKKGVSEGDVEKAVKLVFEDDEDCDQRSSIRLSNSSLQKLYEQASKQWQRSQSVPHETRKARLIRWLQYRGFDWGVVSFILKKLQAQIPR